MSYCQRLTFVEDQPKESFTYRPNTFLSVHGRWLDIYVSFPSPDYYAYWRRLTSSALYTGREFGAWFTPHAGCRRAELGPRQRRWDHEGGLPAAVAVVLAEPGVSPGPPHVAH